LRISISQSFEKENPDKCFKVLVFTEVFLLARCSIQLDFSEVKFFGLSIFLEFFKRHFSKNRYEQNIQCTKTEISKSVFLLFFATFSVNI
jgi:hypothetical protein